MAKRVLILSDTIGDDEGELGAILMKNFLYSVARADEPPAALMFMNRGVRLVCEGSASLEDLALCVERGVVVRACGTCLDYLGLKEKLAVGEAGTMVESVAALLGSDDVVTIT